MKLVSPCQSRFRKLLPDFLHGYLQNTELVEVYAHVEDCDACLLELVRMAQAEETFNFHLQVKEFEQIMAVEARSKFRLLRHHSGGNDAD